MYWNDVFERILEKNPIKIVLENANYKDKETNYMYANLTVSWDDDTNYYDRLYEKIVITTKEKSYILRILTKE